MCHTLRHTRGVKYSPLGAKEQALTIKEAGTNIGPIGTYGDTTRNGAKSKHGDDRDEFERFGGAPPEEPSPAA